jgi:group I intron endonuclease
MEKTRTYCVYKHTSPSGKVYIGITKRDPTKRWCNGKGYRSQRVFFRAIQKYGWNNFEHEILYTGLSKVDAEEKEVELIAEHRCTDRRFGYNVENGGNCGEKHSEETKMKISKANKGRSTWAKGKHFTDDHKHKLRESNLHKQKNSKAVVQMTDEGEVVAIYGSIRDAERQTNINRRCISFCLNGTCKHAGGFIWKGEKK